MRGHAQNIAKFVHVAGLLLKKLKNLCNRLIFYFYYLMAEKRGLHYKNVILNTLLRVAYLISNLKHSQHELT